MARTSTRIRIGTVAAASLAAVFVFAAIAPDAVKAGANSPQARAPQTERVDVKFREGTTVRLRQGHLLSLTGDDVGGLRTVLRQFPGVRVERLFAAPEAALTAQRARLEGRSHRQLADLNLYFRLTTDSPSESASLAAALRTLELVQTAYVEPEATASPTTPSFVGYQGYRGAALAGIHPGAAAGYPGGRGNRVRLFDLEYNWNTSHEDLTRTQNAFISSGASCDPFSNTNHGTAVLGEIVGDDNAIGVTGLVPEVGIAEGGEHCELGQWPVRRERRKRGQRRADERTRPVATRSAADGCRPSRTTALSRRSGTAQPSTTRSAGRRRRASSSSRPAATETRTSTTLTTARPSRRASPIRARSSSALAPRPTARQRWPGRPARSRLDFSTYGFSRKRAGLGRMR